MNFPRTCLRTPLVCPFFQLQKLQLTLHDKYGPQGLFEKASGDSTLNVQSLSRLVCPPLPLFVYSADVSAWQGLFPLKAFYWDQRGARDSYSLRNGNIASAASRRRLTYQS